MSDAKPSQQHDSETSGRRDGETLRLRREDWIRLGTAEEMLLGRELCAFVEGKIFSPSGRERITVTAEDIRAIATNLNGRRAPDPAVIDWEHNSMLPGTSPEEGMSLGEVVSARVDDSDGLVRLYVTPEWTKRGADVVEKSEGVLWTSPEIDFRGVDRRTGDEVGPLMVALALTTRPAQRNDLIDRVQLNRSGGAAQDEEKETMAEENEAGGADLATENEELKAQLAEMRATITNLTTELEAAKGGETEAMSAMRADVDKQSLALNQALARIEKLADERDAANMHRDVEALMTSGRAAPAERKLVEHLWRQQQRDVEALRQSNPKATAEQIEEVENASLYHESFAGRPRNSKVPLDEVDSHGDAPDQGEIPQNRKQIVLTARKLADEQDISITQALSAMRKKNPRGFARAYART